LVLVALEAALVKEVILDLIRYFQLLPRLEAVAGQVMLHLWVA
jgi:hypothetical protein